MNQQPKFCEYCGTPLNPDARFCSQCGKPVKPVAGVVTQEVVQYGCKWMVHSHP